MRRSLLFAVIALLAACVTIEPPPDPRGAVKPRQRLVVMVHQSPGPWIVADPDSKAESAMKMLPLGTFLQGVQEDRINVLSKEIQPYLPRPRYQEAVEAALIAALKAAHDGPVQTAAEAGIAPAQRHDWNAASDQLDWRRKYWFTEPGTPSPRDYSKLLSLDDAVILEVNLSFGLEPDEQDRTLPLLSAASRAYRADTTRMLWAREERLSDTTSSSTLTEFRAAPAELTDRLYALAVPFAGRVAAGFAADAGLRPAPPPILAEQTPAPGLLDLSTPPAAAAPAPAAVEASTGPAVYAPRPSGDGPPAPVFPTQPQQGLPSH
jgi:hypothetical protein